MCPQGLAVARYYDCRNQLMSTSTQLMQLPTAIGLVTWFAINLVAQCEYLIGANDESTRMVLRYVNCLGFSELQGSFLGFPCRV